MSKFDLERLKAETSILDFGERVYGFTPERKRRNYWGFKEYDSLMVNVARNCFYRNNQFKAGCKAKESGNSAGSIIDFIMHFDKCDLEDAIKTLAEFNHCNTEVLANSRYNSKNYVEEKKEFVIPQKYYRCDNARKYLCEERKISKTVVNSLIRRKMLYEEKGYYRNAIFCSYDESGKMVFAQRCSTRMDIDNKKRKFDVSGSSYDECYFINNGASSLIVTEATIDTASFMTLLERIGKKFNNFNHLATTGTNKIVSVLNILSKYPHITKLYVATDNDEAGDEAYQFLIDNLTDWCGTIIRITPTLVVMPSEASVNGFTAKWDDSKTITLDWSEWAKNKKEKYDHFEVYCSEKNRKDRENILIFSNKGTVCKQGFKYAKNYTLKVRGFYYDNNGKKHCTRFSENLEVNIDCVASDINDLVKKNVVDKAFYTKLKQM